MSENSLREDLNQIGREMVCCFLEKRGCLVQQVSSEVSNLIEVVSPLRNEKVKALVYTVESGADTISICIATVGNNNEKRPLLVDYHLVKVCGGSLYYVPDPVVQDVLLKKKYSKIMEVDRSFYVVCHRKLLLDNAVKIEEKAYKHFQPLKHVQTIKPIEKVKTIR